MFIDILTIFVVAVLAFLFGVYQTLKYIKKENNEYRKPVNLPKHYEVFKDQIVEKFEVGNILDIAFRYGFTEGYDERNQIEEDYIDKMVMELSGDTK